MQRPAAICPTTNLTIPECSCRRCLEEQIRSFSPLMRRASLRALRSQEQRADGSPEDGRAAA